MRKIVRNMALLLAIAAILAGVFMALSVSDGYIKGQNLYRKIGADFTSGKKTGADDTENFPGAEERETETELPADAPERLKIDFDGLCAANEDVVGWIQIPAVSISYPVVQADDNDYYLHRSIEKEYLFAGCIFLDCYNDPDLLNYNSIIYGHNMRDGSMFAALKDFNDVSVYDSCPYFWIYTPGGDYLYKIFSVHRAADGSSTYTVRFKDYDSYLEWICQMEDNSSIETNTDISSGDRVITLSTCTGESDKQTVQGIQVAAVKNGTVESQEPIAVQLLTRNFPISRSSAEDTLEELENAGCGDIKEIWPAEALDGAGGYVCDTDGNVYYVAFSWDGVLSRISRETSGGETLYEN